MECVMSQLAGSFTYSECFQFGGGGGGIIRNSRMLYLSDPSTKWLTIYGSDRCCNEFCGPNDNICARSTTNECKFSTAGGGSIKNILF